MFLARALSNISFWDCFSSTQIIIKRHVQICFFFCWLNSYSWMYFEFSCFSWLCDWAIRRVACRWWRLSRAWSRTSARSTFRLWCAADWSWTRRRASRPSSPRPCWRSTVTWCEARSGRPEKSTQTCRPLLLDICVMLYWCNKSEWVWSQSHSAWFCRRAFFGN